MLEDMRACAATHGPEKQGWMKLDGFSNEFPCTPDAGLHLWLEVIGDFGDVDG